MVGGSSNRLALDDAYRAFMDAWNASHPGSAAAGAAANAAVDCADFAPAPDVVRADLFTDDELATKSNHSYELHIDGYRLSGARTEYVEFIWNVPDDDAARCAEHDCYLVGLEALIDQSAFTHHYVLNGCADAWDDIAPGETHKTDAYYVSCDEWSLSGWAPGRDLFYLAPEQASKSITGLKAFAMQVHYDNRNNVRDVVDRSGFRLHYSTRAREAATGSVIGQRLSYSNALQIPAGASRWFLTRTCEITGATDDVNLFSANFHAHLLGAEMYAELWRDGERTTIHNDGAWFFDDQYDRNLEERGLVLKNGDVLQSTCVMDASARSSSTRFGVETTDEMCWVTLSYWPLQAATLRCDGASWTGTLEPGEPAEVIPVTHPNDGYDCFDYDITSSDNEYSCARLAGMDHRDFCAELFCPACAYAHYCDESCGFCLPDFAEEVVACDADELAVLERDDAAAVDAINAMCAPHSDETPVAECEWLILHVQKCAEVDGHPDISENLAYKLDNLGTVADVIRAANVGVHHLYGEDAPIVDGAASPAPFLLSAALGAVALFC